MYDAAPVYDAAPAYEAPVVAEAPAYVAPEAPAFPVSFEPQQGEDSQEEHAADVHPGGAFAYYDRRNAPAVPDLPTPSAGQGFTPDELASPFGWEAAGASALAAAAPDVATEYQPIVDVQSEEEQEAGPAQPDFTSAVFTELSSLAQERPKVEKTSAGLQRRRASDAPTPEVKPIEPDVQLSHKERDADEVRSRFSSFYSGTQRARHDVAEFEQRTQSPAAKE